MSIFKIETERTTFKIEADRFIILNSNLILKKDDNTAEGVNIATFTGWSSIVSDGSLKD